MKKLLLVLLLFPCLFAAGQATYNPSYTPLFTVASKPYAISQAAPVDGRSYKADSINFLWRPYHETTEVLSYLNLAKYRTGQFPIEVNVGGTLNSNGTFTGGYIYEYWFRGGTADTCLVLKSFFPPNLAGFLLAANNLSDVQSVSASRSNLGLGAMATQGTTASSTDLMGTWPGSLVVESIQGHNLAYLLNYNNLTNKPTIPAQFNPIAGTDISLSGTYPNITFSAAANAGMDTVGDIFSLVHIYKPVAPKLVFVADSVTGGYFHYQSTPAIPDSGKIFPATAVGSGFWIRQVDNAGQANPWWYGLRAAVGSDTTGAYANRRFLQRALNYNRRVVIPAGTYYFDSTIYINQGNILSGAKALTGTNGGVLLVWINPVNGIGYANSGDINQFTGIYDLALTTTSTGGSDNIGIVVTRGFFDLERLNVTGFGSDGIRVTSSYNAVNTIADQGIINLVYALSNGGAGIQINGGADNNNVTLSECQATDNIGGGFILGGNHHVLINCNATSNFGFAFKDLGDATMILNPYIESGRGDTVLLEGSDGIYTSGNVFGAVWPQISGTNYTVRVGLINSSTTELVPRLLPDRADTTLTLLDADVPGHLDIGAIIAGSPNRDNIDLDGTTGYTTGVSYFLAATNPPGPSSLNGRYFFQNPQNFQASEYGDNYSVVINSRPGGSNMNATSIGGLGRFIPIYGSVPQAGFSYYGIQGYTGATDAFDDLVIYPRSSNQYRQGQVGLELRTALDTNLSTAVLANAITTREFIDTVTKKHIFQNFGMSFNGGLSAFILDQTQGGNFEFQAGDGSSLALLNTFNKSVYGKYFKNAGTPSATLTDSLIVWEPSDSGYRKLAQSQILTVGHTIFTPTTGGTVNLVDNQYNIINPAGALLALTVVLPSSPADGDFVEIKFTQAVTTVTYSGGTVVDGITSPVAGGYVKFKFDSGTTSWY